MVRISRRDGLLLATAVLAVAAASAPKMGNRTVWDDVFIIDRGEVIHDWSQLPEVFTHRTMYVSEGSDPDVADPVDTYRPVTLATFFLDSAISGRSPTSYHVTNLLAHLACMVLVFLLARRMLPESRRPFAPLAAAWFGLTPLLGEAHVWIDGRSDLFCTLFGLTAVLVWRGAIGRQGLSRIALDAASGVLFLLGLLSKEVLLLAVPALIPFPTEERRPAPSLRARLGRITPFAAACAAYLVARVAVLGGARTHIDTAQLLSAALRTPTLWLDGLVELVLPTRVYVRSLVDDYEALAPWGLVAFAAVALALAVAAFRWRRQVPLLGWSLLWFACTLAPVAIIATMLWPGFGRYLYLPAAGLSVGLADSAARAFAVIPVKRTRRLLAVAGALWLSALGLRLHLWTYDFRSDETLWKSTIASAPDRAHGYGWLGFSRVREGHYRAAIEPLVRARQLDPTEDRYVEQLAWAMHMTGDLEGSLRVALDGLRRFPSNPELHYVAARSLLQSRPRLAARHLIACLRAQPHHATCREAVRILSRTPPFPELLAAEVAASDPRVRAAVRPLLDGG